MDENTRPKANNLAGEADIKRKNLGQLGPESQKLFQIAAQFIPAGSRVFDVGCGAMTLEKFLPEQSLYQPCDVVARDARTVVCDLNQDELPETHVSNSDIITLLGVIEYLYHPEKILQQIARLDKTVLVSYCEPDILTYHRSPMERVNNLSAEAFVAMVQAAGFSIRRKEKIDILQIIFLLEPKQRLIIVKKPKRVLVLSFSNVGNFGDRLGYHIVNSVLPPYAQVTHAHFHPWSVPDTDFDLLILGIGNSLFAPLLTNQLLALLDRIPKKIGIFGTQYRNDFKVEQMCSVVERLDCWFARYKEDINYYGRNNANVVHLGDWLIDAFPLAKSESNDVLNIGQEIWNDLPMDRTIQQIQRHKKVFSTRLHPLLCALTSAEMVSYREQRESGSGVKSGKFRSMLIDVFCRDFPENQFWQVDKEAVLSYKTGVSAKVDQLRQYIKNILC